MKFSGKIGIAEFYESSPSVWEERITERHASGDVISNSRFNSQSSELLDDINISNRISIVANPKLISQMGFIRYVVFRNVRWKIKDVTIEYPRLLLSLGGVYNGPVPTT